MSNKKIQAEKDSSIKDLFHKLWSKDVGTKNYNKDDWKELRDLLQEKGVIV